MGDKRNKRKQRMPEPVAYRFGWVLNNVPKAVYFALMMARLLDWLKAYGKKARWVFQHEIGETGHEHVQGYLHIRRTTATSPDRISTLLNKLAAITQLPMKDISVRIESNAGYGALGRYCTKEGDGKNSGTQWSDGGFRRETLNDRAEPTQEEIDLKKTIETHGLAYQKKTIKYIKHPKADGRQAVWWWSRVGRTGKSTFVRYLNVWHKAIVIGPGSSRNMAQSLLTAIEMVQNTGGDPADHLGVIVIDFTRAEGAEAKGVDAEVCQFIEQVKNSSVLCEKYKSQQLNLQKWLEGKAPKVIVFANREPDRSTMSADRWCVGEITQQLPEVVEDLAAQFDWNEDGWEGCEPSEDWKEKIEKVAAAKKAEEERKKAEEAVPDLANVMEALVGMEEFLGINSVDVAADMKAWAAVPQVPPQVMVWDPTEEEKKEKEPKPKEAPEEKKKEISRDEREKIAAAADPQVAAWLKSNEERKAQEKQVNGKPANRYKKVLMKVNEQLIDFRSDGKIICIVCDGEKEAGPDAHGCTCYCYNCNFPVEECQCAPNMPEVLVPQNRVPAEVAEGLPQESPEESE